MSIRRKTLLLGTGTLLVLFVLLYNSAHAILLSSFEQIEDQRVQENVERAANAIADTLSSMSATAADWSYWDDTYTFVQGANDSYIEDNLANETLVNLGLNVIVLTDEHGNVVFTKALDLSSGEETDFPPGLVDMLLESRTALDSTDALAQLAGLVDGPDQLVMVATRHILDSQLRPPVEGTLIFGRYLDDERIAAFSDSLRLSLTVHPINDSTLMAELATSPVPLTGFDIISQPLSDEVIAGYTPLHDIQGKPVRILRMEMARDIYLQGRASLQYFLVALVIIGVVFTLVIWLLNDRVILCRITQLGQSVAHIRDTGDTSVDVSIPGNDEIAHLSADINSMLLTLAKTQDALQKAHDNLELQVAERTRDLQQSNTQLQQEIIERKQAQAQLAQARDQALEALQLKSRILANISHDARTPLSVISLRAEMLRRGHFGQLTDSQNDKLDSILINAQQLLGFIENLLTSAQIEASKISLKPVEIAPHDLLETLMETQKPLAERKGLKLEWSVTPQVAPVLWVDTERFNQILQNLVNNAIKFTEKGSVWVQIDQPDSDHWMLEVSDTGPGIDPEARKRIFEPFWQVDSSLVRVTNRGIGLGLSIVMQLATLMDGDVTVKSEPGAGTTFRVSLPLQTIPMKRISNCVERVSG